MVKEQRARGKDRPDKGPVAIYKSSLDFYSWLDNSYQSPEENENSNKKDFNINDRTRAETLFETEISKFQKLKTKKGTANDKWLATVASSGTLSDKLSAYTLQVQEAPLFRLSAIEILVNMAKKKGKRIAQLSIETLKELFLNTLLPNRKLLFFHERTALKASDEEVMYWIFEDKLKRLYAEFIQLLEKSTHDSVTHTREVSIKTAFDLLVSKPEQERKLLGILINKLGDAEKSVCSKASFLLSRLVRKHPNMKLHVVKDIESFLYRTNVGLRAQYYAVIFLNQLILGPKDQPLASKLISAYFTLFELYAKKGEVDSKLMDGLLTGISRAFPYAPRNEKDYDEHVDTLFKMVHISTFNKSVQALQVLYHVMRARKSISDRFYRALYGQLLAKDLRGSSRAVQFLNIIYKSMRQDHNKDRVKAFVKRMLQICPYEEPNFICTTLYTISEIAKAKSSVWMMLIHTGDDEEEHYKDIDEETEEKEESSKPEQKSNAYDPLKREPQFANAQNSALWELVILTQHYHPSVVKFAETLLRNKHVQYPGDPMQDFSQTAFLERFVYKNPKKKLPKKGQSIMKSKRVRRTLVEEPVTAPSFTEKDESQVAETDLFFFKYFKSLESQGKRQKKPKKELEGEEFDILDMKDSSANDDFKEDISDSDEGSSDEERPTADADDDEFDYSDMKASDFDEDDDDVPAEGNLKDFGLTEEDLDLSDDEFDNEGMDDSTYANADEFATLLEDSSSSGVNAKQAAWEERASKKFHSKKRKKFHKGSKPTNKHKKSKH